MAQPSIDTGWPVTVADSVASALNHSLSTPVTAGPNRLIVVAASYASASAIGPLTISGLGLTWTLITSHQNSPTNNQGTMIWAAWAKSTLSAGTITIGQALTATSDVTATAWAYSNTPDGSQNINACFGSVASASQGVQAIAVTLTGVLSTSGAVCALIDLGSHVTLTAQTNTTLSTQNADTQGIGVSQANGHLNTSASGSVTIGSTTSNTNYVSGVEILYWNQPPTHNETDAKLPVRAPNLAAERFWFSSPPRLLPLVAGSFAGPDRYFSPLRSASLTHVAWGPYTNIIPPAPVPPALPERAARPIWNPERSLSVLTLTQAQAATPTFPPAAFGPERFARPIWNPERSAYVWNPYTFVPPSEWPPALPGAFLRPPWTPPRTFAIWPQTPPGAGMFISLSATTVEINETFTVFMVVTMPTQCFRITVREVFPTATPPGLVRFDRVQTRSQSGYGWVVLPNEPIFMEPAESRLFIWTGVAYAKGTYAIGATMVDAAGTYYPSVGTAPGPDFLGPPFIPIGASATLTVNGP